MADTVNNNKLKNIFDAQPIRILVVAVWFALLTGLAEALFRVIWRQWIRHEVIWTGRDVLWMAPVSLLMFFLPVGLLLAMLAWRWPALISIRLVTLVFAFMSFTALLLVFPQLQGWSVVLLAFGLAFQASRMIVARQPGFYRLARGMTVLLMLAVLGLALGGTAVRKIRERRTVAQLPPATNGAPNVLLIVLDTVSAKSLSAYGYERRTSPELERLAGRGVVFENAISTAPWTLPSHASMFTGRLPNELDAGWTQPLGPSYPTLAESLSGRGYESAGFVANLVFCTDEHGLSRGMVRYEDFPLTLGQTFISSTLGQKISDKRWFQQATGYHDDLNRKNAEKINEGFLNWLSSRDNQRPFFAFLNYFDAHEPHLPPAPFDTRFGPNQPRASSFFSRGDVEANRWRLPPHAQQVERNLYDGSIAYLDHQLGLLFAEMERRGTLRNTVIIVTSDHGEQFGEHGLYNHSNSLYLSLLHVPLMIIFPSDVPSGVRIQQAVSLRDLPATIVDLIGADETIRFPGNTLARYWVPAGKKEETTEESVYSEAKPGFHLEEWYPTAKGAGNMKSLIRGRYHFIYNGDRTEELYDWKSDPNENVNLAKSDESRPVLQTFRLSLETILTRK